MRTLALSLLAAHLLTSPAFAEPMDAGTRAETVFSAPAARHLAEAACAGDLARVDALLAEGADPNAAGRFGVTPLIWALTCKGLVFNDVRANRAVATGRVLSREEPPPQYLASLEALLRAGADPNAIIEGDFGPIYPGASAYWIDQRTPVLIASEFHEAPVLRLLLAHGGAPDAVDGDASTWALSLAFERGRWLDLGPLLTPDRAWPWDNLHLLLQSGARLDQVVEGRYNVVEAASMNDPSLVLHLLQTYDYTGDYDIIAYFAMEGIAMGFPGKEERLALLGFLRDERGVDLDAIKARYRLAGWQRESLP